MQKGDFVKLPEDKSKLDPVGKVISITDGGLVVVECLLVCDPQDLEVIS